MRILRFIVEKQMIKQDPSCDFSGLVPGTEGYLQAVFTFDDTWKGCRKAAVFTRYGKTYPVPLKSNACLIPKTVLNSHYFQVSVVGVRDQYKITTSKTEVKQDG